MGKITIKHYLNKNLKPYKIKDEKYYMVHILITVNRKTTRVRSKAFEEICTENDFEEIERTEQAGLYEESKTIETLIQTQLDMFNEFDTSLFCAFYNLMDKYNTNRIPHYRADFLGNITDEKTQNECTFYDIFRPSTQKRIAEIIESTDFKNVGELNKAVMRSFFEILEIVARSTQKYRFIPELYQNQCERPHLFFETANKED